MDLIQCLNDKQLLGQFFPGDTWGAWHTLWRAFYAADPEPGDFELFREATGRSEWPSVASEELWVCCGVRSAKSRMIAAFAVWSAVFGRHRLAAGEIGFILIVSQSKEQANIIRKYASEFLADNPLLADRVIRETQSEIDLDNNISIKVMASDYRTVRGFSAIACIIDEIGYLSYEGSRPDYEVVDALRSRLAMSGGPFIAIGSPHAKRGSLWNAYREYWGRDSDDSCLFWKLPSQRMNPLIKDSTVQRAIAADKSRGEADYLAEFRSDVEIFVNPEVVESCVVPKRFELPPGDHRYLGFVDPSGGAGQDSMCLGIGHFENDLLVVDCLLEKTPPFSPDDVISEFVMALKRYKIDRIWGDNWGGEWCKKPFDRFGITYEVCKLSKRDLYLHLLPRLNSKQIQLLDHPKTTKQICGLERHTRQGGKDIIDHPPRGHDDLVNVIAGLGAMDEISKPAGTWNAGDSFRRSRSFDLLMRMKQGRQYETTNTAAFSDDWPDTGFIRRDK